MNKKTLMLLAAGVALGYFAAPNLVTLPVVGPAFSKAAEIGMGS